MTRSEGEQAVLALGQRIDWSEFRWLPSSSIGAGEEGWRLFIETHSDRELLRVLEEAEKVQGEKNVSTGQSDGLSIGRNDPE